MMRYLVLAWLLVSLVVLAGSNVPDVGLGNRDLHAGFDNDLVFGGAGSGLNPSAIGQDLIAGDFWTPDVDFSDATVYYFDPNASEGGDGSLASPFMGLGEEVYLDNHIERRASIGGAIENPGAVVGAGDLCVLMSGDHGKIRFEDYYFSDYLGIVAAPGQVAEFDFFYINASSYLYVEGLTADKTNTRSTTMWPVHRRHVANDYTDFDAAPYFVRAVTDTNNNGTPSHIVLKDLKLGISSGSAPATWDWEDWNTNAVSGIRVDGPEYVHIQGCSGVGMNYGIFSEQDDESKNTYGNYFNNTFRYLNGDGLYLSKSRINHTKGNDFSDFYISNDNHVDMIAAYPRCRDNIFEGNKLTITTDVTRNPLMAGYTGDGGTEGVGVPAFNLIGGNSNTIVRNNVINGNLYGLVNLRTLEGSSYNVKVINNTITCNSQQAHDNPGDVGNILTRIDAVGSDTLQVEISNNICSVVEIDANDSWSTEDNNSEYARDFSTAGFNDWTLDADPLTQDVSLDSKSTNVDGGILLNSPSEDYVGLGRPHGSAVDIGAYEYNDGLGYVARVNRLVMYPPLAEFPHNHSACDSMIAIADEVLVLGEDGDVPEFSWVHLDSAVVSTSSSVWLDNGSRWTRSEIASTSGSGGDDWSILGNTNVQIGLFYIDFNKYVPAGATILSATLNVTPYAIWYSSANDSLCATLMTTPADSIWYAHKGNALTGADSAPNLSYANWSYQKAGLGTGGYPAANGGAWTPSLEERLTFEDWGDVSDWTGFGRYAGFDPQTGGKISLDIKNCVQAAINGTTNNGIMWYYKRPAGFYAHRYMTWEPRPAYGSSPYDQVPWVSITYTMDEYQEPFQDGDFLFLFTTDDGRKEANETYSDVFKEFGWKYSAYYCQTHFDGGTDDPTTESMMELLSEGHEVGSHSRRHLSPYGIANWDLSAGMQGANWDSLIRDTDPDWLHNRAYLFDGDRRDDHDYFAKTFALPNNSINGEGVVALNYHGYYGFRMGLERKASAVNVPDYFREMTYNEADSDSMRVAGIPDDMMREQNIMGLPLTLEIQDVVGEETDTGITEDELKWNFRRLIRQALAQKTRVISLFCHDFKGSPYTTYNEGLDEEELRWLLEVVEEMGGTAWRMRDYKDWQRRFSAPVATPAAYTINDSLRFTVEDSVWWEPTPHTRLYPYEEK